MATSSNRKPAESEMSVGNEICACYDLKTLGTTRLDEHVGAEEEEDGNGPPKQLGSLISLRLPATFLTSIVRGGVDGGADFAATSIVLQSDEEKATTKHGNMSASGKKKFNCFIRTSQQREESSNSKISSASVDSIPIRIDEVGQTEVYMRNVPTFTTPAGTSSPAIIQQPQSDNVSKKKNDSTSDLHYMGTTTKRFLIDPKTVLKVKEIGKKTRERLAAERRKRKEIVRIDGEEERALLEDGGTGENSAARKRRSSFITMESTKKRRLKTTSPRAATTRQKRVTTRRSRSYKPDNEKDAQFDTWMPDVTSLSAHILSKDERSNVVRIHGLPYGTRPEQVKKFFGGLDPERVFVLPTCNDIFQDFDPCTEEEYGNVDDMKRKKEGPQIQRYSNTIRVYVKFKSAPVAEMAVERTGEKMSTEESGDGMSGRTSAAAVAVTLVSKTVASFLLRNMAIDGVKGRPIHSTVTETEQQLQNNISEAIWVMTVRALGLKKVTNTNSRRKENIPFLELETYSHISVPMDIQSYRKLAIYHNRIVDEYEKLELETTCLYLRKLDPSLPDDPVIRLTSVVGNWFLDELERIEFVLHRFRIERNKTLQRESNL